MVTLMVTMPAVGATGGRPREPLNLGHRPKWRGLNLPHPWLPGVEALHPRRATAGRPLQPGRVGTAHHLFAKGHRWSVVRMAL